MKGRESGMPDRDCWESFFDAGCIVERLECAALGSEDVVEIGSGYGTFTFPVTERTTGSVYAFDIEENLVALLRREAEDAQLSNLRVIQRDVVGEGTGLEEASVDHVMVYNFLHIEDPVRLLREAFRILRAGGKLSIIHWKHDPSTPRGPSMDIRPRAEQCRSWAELAGFSFVRNQDLSACCDYHYGMILAKSRFQEEFG